MTAAQAFWKRLFDLVLSLVGLCFAWWVILLAWIASTIDTRKNGFFIQQRIGLHGKPFNVIKIRTMRNIAGVNTTVTTSADPRITKVGTFLRKTKIDELPQLFNVLIGQMSFVGPRPDVAECYKALNSEERIILNIRPGITGPATLKYRDEEQLLLHALNPDAYNRDVIFPDKVRINMDYIKHYKFSDDLKYIMETVLPAGENHG